MNYANSFEKELIMPNFSQINIKKQNKFIIQLYFSLLYFSSDETFSCFYLTLMCNIFYTYILGPLKNSFYSRQSRVSLYE